MKDEDSTTLAMTLITTRKSGAVWRVVMAQPTTRRSGAAVMRLGGLLTYNC